MRVFGSILLGVSLIGCVAAKGDESFVIVHHQAPDPDICAFTSDKTTPFLPQGVVHLSGISYVAAPVMESRIIAPEGRESLRTIFVEGANVTLEVSEAFVVQNGSSTTLGSPQTFEYQVLFSGAISPNGGVTTSIYDVIPFPIMAELKSMFANVDPFDLNTQIGLQAVATSTAFGDYYGDRLDSTPFTFPINITNTNMAVIGACPIDPTLIQIPEPTNACSSVQDTVLICCSQGGTAVCPPTIVAP